jgi:hypothetical protein
MEDLTKIKIFNEHFADNSVVLIARELPLKHLIGIHISIFSSPILVLELSSIGIYLYFCSFKFKVSFQLKLLLTLSTSIS